MIMLIALIFLIVIIVFMSFACWRLYRKLVIYDEVFQYLSNDIEVNLKQFAKISHSAMLSNDSEIQAAHLNMLTMGKRMNEILTRMEEATGLDLRPPPEPPRPRFA